MGGWSNSRSVLRREWDELTSLDTPAVLSETEERRFWFSAVPDGTGGMQLQAGTIKNSVYLLKG